MKMINNELLNEALKMHNKYQTEGAYIKELESTLKTLDDYLNYYPTADVEPSKEEKSFIEKMFNIRFELMKDKGMMNEGYILTKENPNFKLHYYYKDCKNDSEDCKTLCARLEPIKQ